MSVEVTARYSMRRNHTLSGGHLKSNPERHYVNDASSDNLTHHVKQTQASDLDITLLGGFEHHGLHG